MDAGRDRCGSCNRVPWKNEAVPIFQWSQNSFRSVSEASCGHMECFPQSGGFYRPLTKAKGFNRFAKVNAAFGKIEPLRWHIADSSRIYQDEYLEWSVLRNDKDNVVRISYTCEGPEVS